jgi:hypothetical protein
MTVRVGSATRPWSFGVVALALTFAGWGWFGLCFTARAAAWWNSLSLFVVLYVVAVLLALRGIRSWFGIAALILAGLSLGLVLLLSA